ncbi:MAG: hypothetical protein EA425_11265 [Puniceicoccaceae bacterium]|nr:MAG: hypothetical protein EA425_11265 [Puniceicoccaceae bacterium]
MSANEFRKKSSKFLARRKNPIIRDLDKLLSLYHASPDNPRRRLKIVILIYVWCQQYLYGGGGTGSRGGVGELLQQATATLKDPSSEMTLKLAHQGARWKDGDMQTPSSMKAKAMGQGYQMEPLLPGKGSVGGVALEHQLKRINTPALRGLFEDKITADLDRKGTQYTMKDVIRQAEDAMATAGIAEFLDVFVAFTADRSYATRADFEYCNKHQRNQYLLHFDSASGLCYRDDQLGIPYTTDVGNQQGWALYAMDLNHRLYAKPSSQVPDGAFNHSSFMSGKPVICAGAIEFDPAGRLRSISNESGHYRPTLGDLAHALHILHADFNVDLLGVEAVANAGGTKTTMDAYQCMSIYANYPRSSLADF